MVRPIIGSGNRSSAHRTSHWQASPTPSTPADARDRVRAALAEWGVVGPVREDVVLVVSELVTNAVEHARTPLAVTLTCNGDGVQVRVHDHSPDPPELRSTEHDAKRGWGLRMIEQTASWGWEEHPEGKIVWATIPLDRRRLHPVRP